MLYVALIHVMAGAIRLMLSAAFLIFGQCHLAVAGNSQSAFWFQAGALSYHPDRDHEYNERNGGGGIEYQFTRRHLLALGVYKNSYSDTTRYAYYIWSPIEFHALSTRAFWIPAIRIGILAGIFDGYRRRNNGSPAPVLLPVAVIEWRHVGINITAFPPIDEVDGGIAAQLKLRF